MKRHLVFLCLAFAFALALSGCGARSSSGPPAILIQKARVGFSAGVEGERFKPGHWTPVYVDLQAGPNGIKAGQYGIVVTTADVDNVGNQFTLPLPAADPQESFTITTYVKPSTNPEITVTAYELVKSDENQPARLGGKVGEAYGADQRYVPQPADSVLYLSVGARLPELEKTIRAEPNGENATEFVASLDAVQQMPTEWFGYDGVDVVFLGTSNRTGFTEKLVGDQRRWNALAEWVRRGGKIVISAGRTQNLVANLDEQHPLLPMTVTGDKVKLPENEKGLYGMSWRDRQDDFRLTDRGRDGKVHPIELARLRPKGPADAGLKPDHYRVSEQVVPRRPEDGPPLIVRGTYGLGQVVLVTTDLDQMPFSERAGDTSPFHFWKSFRTELATRQEAPQMPRGMFMGNQVGGTDIATRLEQGLEYFEDIPVIGFGWVALFILLYIVVVGPLDYLFLKKVVKRLELTWITFPVVVLVISVLAYFTAYWIKGDKLKINKVDLVDIDMQTEQVYGHTWFTLFSPRIDHYTIGLEPAAPRWAPGETSDPRMLVSWMDRPETNPFGRSRSQSFFRRTYDYAPEAAGLRGVPIQVWSTKSFEASWEVPARKQLFSSTLRHPANQESWITGTITSHLPVELQDVVVFYQNKWYKLDNLAPEVETRLDGLQNPQPTRDPWYQASGRVAIPSGARRPSDYREPTDATVKTLLFFHDATANPGQAMTSEHNASLRSLDQSWRLRHCQDEVIVYGKVPVVQGEAGKVAEDPESPSRLWLKDLPQSGQKWAGLSGTLRQETYVRIFIPVFAEPKAGGK